jgi:hypothetical protein
LALGGRAARTGGIDRNRCSRRKSNTEKWENVKQEDGEG